MTRLITCLATALVSSGLSISPASYAGDSPEPSAPTPHIATKLDPTDFRTRLELRNRYQGVQFGGYRDVLTPRLDYAFSKTFAMRFELPVMHSDFETRTFPANTGMGDFEMRTTYRAYRAEKMALVIGCEFFFDTADSFQLGAGKNTLAPVVFASIDVPSLNSTFFPNIQYFHSVAGDDKRTDVNYTATKVFVLTRWPANFYTGSEAIVFFDHERNNRVGATFEIETGRFISPRVAVWVRPGIGIKGDDIPQIYNWNLEVGFRYLFD